jgi:energy-coupling factor transporter ATP-binding protein EcfA2
MSPTIERGTPRETIIEVRNLVKRFGDNVVHKDLNLEVYRGEVLSIVGGSGSGKTVLLRQIVGLDRPTSGTIRCSARIPRNCPLTSCRPCAAAGAAVPARRAVLRAVGDRQSRCRCAKCARCRTTSSAGHRCSSCNWWGSPPRTPTRCRPTCPAA